MKVALVRAVAIYVSLGVVIVALVWLGSNGMPEVRDDVDKLDAAAPSGEHRKLIAGPAESQRNGSDFVSSEVPAGVSPTEQMEAELSTDPETNSASDGALLFFFLTENEYLEVSGYWSDQFKSDRASWVGKLDAVFQAENGIPNSEDMESLALQATMNDPKFRYEPSINESDLEVSCRNDICKVEMPPSTKSFAVRTVPITDPNDVLHPNDRVLFDHGFGHSVSHLNTLTGVRTHYFLANGFEFAS